MTRDRTRYTAQMGTVSKALELVMNKMEAQNYKILQENNGMVTIMFTRKGDNGMVREYHFICDTFTKMSDNFRACQLAISRLWSIYEECGIRTHESESSFDNLAAGFRVLESQKVLLALPDPKNRSPFEILNIPRDATKKEIEKAFKKYAKIHHPDKGGNTEIMQLGTQARNELLEMMKP